MFVREKFTTGITRLEVSVVIASLFAGVIVSLFILSNMSKVNGLTDDLYQLGLNAIKERNYQEAYSQFK